MPQTSATDLIDSGQASEILHISRRTLHRLVAAGQIKPFTIAPGGPHGAYLFRRRDIERRAKKVDAA